MDNDRCSSFEDHRSCSLKPVRMLIMITLGKRGERLGKPFSAYYCAEHAELWVSRGAEKGARFKVLVDTTV